MAQRRSTQARLRDVLQAGNLTRTELAAWLTVPYQTLRGWIEKGRAPSGAPLDVRRMFDTLQSIEQRVLKKQGLPVPTLPRKERLAYLKRLQK